MAKGPIGAGNVDPGVSHSRLEGLSDLVFGLALSIGAVFLLGNPPTDWPSLLGDVTVFGFSFVVLITVWLHYTRSMAALGNPSRSVLRLNLALLFLVAIEPFLFNVAFGRTTSAVSAGYSTLTGALYAVDLGCVFVILGLLSAVAAGQLGTKPAAVLTQQLVRWSRNFELGGAIFLLSALPFFYNWSIAGTGFTLRYLLWFGPLVVGRVWQRRAGAPPLGESWAPPLAAKYVGAPARGTRREAALRLFGSALRPRGGPQMPTVSLRYQFRQPFRAPAPAAYAWCTDFRPADAELFADRRTRSVRRIAPDALVMTDVTYPAGRRTRIRRLVRLFPEQLAWTNTHLDGPFRHSQFWYRIAPDGAQKSHLEFAGLKLESHARTPGKSEVARLAEANRRSDAATWSKHLGPALEAELGGSRGPPRRH